jgi:hypothetical protein
MKVFCFRACSAFFVAALLVTTVPTAQAARGTLRAADRRCERTAGREKDRCKFINARIERLRFRHARVGYQRGHLLREMRHVSKNRPVRDIRRIGNPNLARLRRHNRNGGNARRLINIRDEKARSKCADLRSTEKYLCIRNVTRASSRGNTR